jgi:signal transduction histidine kinase
VVSVSSRAARPDETDPDGPRRAGEPAFLGRLRRVGATSDGTAAEDGLTDLVDRVAAFAPAILVIRWLTTMASLVLSVSYLSSDNPAVAIWCGVILAYTVVRTSRPVRYVGDLRSLLSVIAEVMLLVVAVSTTGHWESPLIFSLVTAITVAGFARGFGFAIRVGLLAALTVSVPYVYPRWADPQVMLLSVEWTLVLLLVAIIAGYARRISGEADRQHTLALDRLGRLADAHALLFSLHRVTQMLPASLDLDDVLDTTVGRLRGLFDFDFGAVLVYDDTAGDWQLVRRDGTRLPARLTTAELPPPLRRAIAEHDVVNVPDLPENGGPGLAPKASSGIYAVLPARGSVIGLLAVEHSSTGHFSARDVELVRGMVESVALSIDNARWFGRLRTVGADEERARIARDLHDNIGQSLAYLAFELDRIVNAHEGGNELGPSLQRLREDVRGVIREVRDTLYDLRTDVSDSQDMAAILEAYAARVTERSGIEIEVYSDRAARLPILQEREMWRIAQEALTNVERHAHATRVRVLWRCNGEAAALEVTDNGVGFPIGRAGRLDSYGILGMRERASSIGATLDITSEPEKGTRVRCTLVRHAESTRSPAAAFQA